MPTFDQLRAIRQAAYERLGKARDATFELTDAVLLTRNAYSLADLSLCPVFRRKWPSVYEALQDSRPQRQKLETVCGGRLCFCSRDFQDVVGELT
ncbi:MAG TPA: hypothetical protein V6D48_19690, partial [Oculatellaceae cyanobacterium]